VGVSAGRTGDHVHGWCGLKIARYCNVLLPGAAGVAHDRGCTGAGWWCLYRPHTT